MWWWAFEPDPDWVSKYLMFICDDISFVNLSEIWFFFKFLHLLLWIPLKLLWMYINNHYFSKECVSWKKKKSIKENFSKRIFFFFVNISQKCLLWNSLFYKANILSKVLASFNGEKKCQRLLLYIFFFFFLVNHKSFAWKKINTSKRKLCLE